MTMRPQPPNLPPVSQDSGQYAHTPHLHCFHFEFTSDSRVHRLHSSCTAESGWTACALRMSSGLVSLTPMYLILPSSTSSWERGKGRTETSDYGCDTSVFMGSVGL